MDIVGNNKLGFWNLHVIVARICVVKIIVVHLEIVLSIVKLNERKKHFEIIPSKRKKKKKSVEGFLSL